MSSSPIINQGNSHLTRKAYKLTLPTSDTSNAVRVPDDDCTPRYFCRLTTGSSPYTKVILWVEYNRILYPSEDRKAWLEEKFLQEVIISRTISAQTQNLLFPQFGFHQKVATLRHTFFPRRFPPIMRATDVTLEIHNHLPKPFFGGDRAKLL